MLTWLGNGSPSVVLMVSVTLVDAPSSSWVWATENDPVVSARAGLAPSACAMVIATKTPTPTSERRTAKQ
jgi:hypothetical protein